ncbi:hypothetical protein LINPERHAP2_LOCUS35725 [Linum perenne]
MTPTSPITHPATPTPLSLSPARSNEIASSCTEDKELLHDLFNEETEAATSDHDDPFEELEAEKGENVDTSSLDCQDEAEIDELEANLKVKDAEDRGSTIANQGTWMGKKEHQRRAHLQSRVLDADADLLLEAGEKLRVMGDWFKEVAEWWGEVHTVEEIKPEPVFSKQEDEESVNVERTGDDVLGI